MRDNSNVEVQKEESYKLFPRHLVGEMWDANVTFETILHIPTLGASSNYDISEHFQDFLNSACNEQQYQALLDQCPAIKSTLNEIKTNSDILDYASEIVNNFARECGAFEFLIKIETRVPFNFKFNEKGEYLSNSLGGFLQMQWILAKNMINACEIALNIAEKIHNEAEEKARKEQGLEA